MSSLGNHDGIRSAGRARLTDLSTKASHVMYKSLRNIARYISKHFAIGLVALSVTTSNGLAQSYDQLGPASSNEGVTQYVSSETPATESVAAASNTQDGGPWWESQVGAPTRHASQVPLSIEQLLLSALEHSAQIKVFSDLPLIRETAITEADAAFDWTAFMESRWDDTSVPVGSTLTTGGPERFLDQNFNYSVGARRRNTFGGQVEVSQRVGHQRNNSVFFLPNDQGNSQLTVSYTQPLLRGAGKVYNTSLTVLAQIDTKIARDEFSRQLQSHLLEVTRAYWSLYMERATLLQKQRLLSRADQILQDLERRQSLDTVNSQVVRARAAVESRRAEILRAETAVRNAESKIRALTNDPRWGDSDASELIPSNTPFRVFTDVDMASAMNTAMRSRPEIGQAIKQCKASSVRMSMAKNEVLPALNMILESYASGLRGDSDIGGAWTDQFAEGRPSYSAGLQYEVPIWNRAAKARLQRRRLEVRQLQNQFRTTAETVKLEVAVAVRELRTSYQEMGAKMRSMQAAAAEVNYISERWKALGGEDRAASLMLEDLLSAQTRLADAEFGFLNSSLTYNLAQMNYKKAVGTLLQDERIQVQRDCKCNLPGQSVSKAAAANCNCQNGSALPQSEVTSAPLATQSVEEPWSNASYQTESQTPSAYQQVISKPVHDPKQASPLSPSPTQTIRFQNVPVADLSETVPAIAPPHRRATDADFSNVHEPVGSKWVQPFVE